MIKLRQTCGVLTFGIIYITEEKVADVQISDVKIASAVLLVAFGLFCYGVNKVGVKDSSGTGTTKNRFCERIAQIRQGLRHTCETVNISGGGGISALLAVVLVCGCLFPSSLQLARGEESGDAAGDGSGTAMQEEASASVTIQVDGDDAIGLNEEPFEHGMLSLEEYMEKATSGGTVAPLSLEGGTGEVTSAQLAETYAVSNLQPGTRDYYNSRWQDAVNKVKAAGINGTAFADTSRKANDGGALVPWTGNTLGTMPVQGDGSQGNPYAVYTADELRYSLANQKSCILMQDIDLGGLQGVGWTALPVSQPMIIDGNGHTIWNLYSSSSDTTGAPYVGFLGEVTSEGFKMTNLNFSNTMCESVYQYNGHLATVIGGFNAGSVEGCSLENALVGPVLDASGEPQSDQMQQTMFGIGGMFTSSGYSATGVISIKNTYTRNVHVRGTHCVANFYEGGWGRDSALPQSKITIENCAAMDGTVLASVGHSGGFISCTGPIEADSCFANLDVYGNNQTGGFCGVIHKNVQLTNCWSSGKVEGVANIGGFVSGVGSTDTVSSRITNCYSTSMVGMGATATNMGGFAGTTDDYSSYKPPLVMNNCYAAGEVGTLRSKPDGTAVDSSDQEVKSVGGFSGGDTNGQFSNCFYDKQTTGSAEKAIGGESAPTKVAGLLSKSLTTKNMGAGWSTSNGSTYPQLSAFTTGTWGGSAKLGELARAYSQASVSTVFLYPCNNDAFDPAATDYDTVRKIRYAFPLTNNKMVNNASIDTSWVYDPDNKAYYPNDSPLNPGTKIITLSAAQGEPAMDEVSVTAVASGIDGCVCIRTTMGWWARETCVSFQPRRLRSEPTIRPSSVPTQPCTRKRQVQTLSTSRSKMILRCSIIAKALSSSLLRQSIFKSTWTIASRWEMADMRRLKKRWRRTVSAAPILPIRISM